MFSPAAVRLRSIPSVPGSSEEVTETPAPCQSPVMSPGIFPGTAVGDESGPAYLRPRKGSPGWAGLGRYEQAWEGEATLLPAALEAD